MSSSTKKPPESDSSSDVAIVAKNAGNENMQPDKKTHRQHNREDQITDSRESTQKTKQSKKPEKSISQTSPKAKFGVAGWFGLIALVGLAALSAYSFTHFSQQRSIYDLQRKLIVERLTTNEREYQRQFTQFSNTLANVVDTQQQNATELDAQLAMVRDASEQQLAQTVASLRQEFLLTPQVYARELAEQLVDQAQLSLSTGVAPTVIIQQLHQSQRLLDNATGEGLAQLRSALDADIADISLLAQNNADISEIVANIAALIRQVRELAFVPIVNEVLPSSDENTSSQQTNKHWLAELQTAFIAIFADLVTISQRQDGMVAVDLSQQAFLQAKRLLEMQLHMAQLHLVSGDQQDFNLAITQALELIDSYFVAYPITALRSHIADLSQTSPLTNRLILRSYSLLHDSSGR